LAQAVAPCRCRHCRALDDEDDPGPPITVAQRAYCDTFVAWFRGSDTEREQLEPVLATLALLIDNRTAT